MVKKIFILLVFFSYIKIAAQNRQYTQKISVITCSPAEALYSTFGHSAIRIVDSSNHTDYVFNYGAFNFEDPNFYTKFLMGKLNYYLLVEDYKEFISQNIQDRRSVYEQELHISSQQKRNIIISLEGDLKGANRYYKYDFLFDNCTTRIRDIVFNNINNAYITTQLTRKGASYRDLLHEYLDKGNRPWSKLCFDILLGRKTDNTVNINQSMFLPEYLLKGVDSLKVIKSTNYISTKKTLLFQHHPTDKPFKNGPLFISICISLIIVSLSFLQKSWTFITKKIIDFLLLFLTGLLGFFLLFMWFGTDHEICSNNYNLCWALPTNIFASFYMWRNNDKLKIYLLFISVSMILLLLTWFVIPQKLNIALFPLSIACLIRYTVLYQSCQKLQKL